MDAGTAREIGSHAVNVHLSLFNDACRWIAKNDAPGDDHDVETLAGYLTVVLVADVFGSTPEDVASIVYRMREKE
jgi:hypothetical protein